MLIFAHRGAQEYNNKIDKLGRVEMHGLITSYKHSGKGSLTLKITHDNRIYEHQFISKSQYIDCLKVGDSVHKAKNSYTLHIYSIQPNRVVLKCKMNISSKILF